MSQKKIQKKLPRKPAIARGGSEASKSPDGVRPLRIGAVARQLGVSASMIRSWEQMGLRREATAQGEHRLYEQSDIDLLCRAVYLRKVQGLNAPAIIEQLRREGLLPGVGEQQAVAHTLALGSYLRSLRLTKKQSLAQVAAAVGISTGFLSNLERSQTGVSVGIMHKLAHHFGTSLSAFYYQAESPGPLVTKTKRRLLSHSDGVRMEELAWGNIVMEPHIMHIAPGKGSQEFYTHQGQEFIYMLKGALAITLDMKEYKLAQGDSFYFASNTRHHWHNPGKSEAVVLWVNTAERLALVR
jgi:DNA-binding transcriptional MerR regulator